jgi:hypothetical protein
MTARNRAGRWFTAPVHGDVRGLAEVQLARLVAYVESL